VCAAIVVGRHLDIEVVLAPIDVPILNLAVREMHVAVEVRHVVFAGPLFDLTGVPIVPSRRIRAAPF
jgi:hypothetical protein